MLNASSSEHVNAAFEKFWTERLPWATSVASDMFIILMLRKMVWLSEDTLGGGRRKFCR